MESYLNGEQPISQTEPTQTELAPPARLFGDVIALAASDCRRAIDGVRQGRVSKRLALEAISACRFFLSSAGQDMVLNCGLGNDGIRAGVALARTALTRLDVAEPSVMRGDDAHWHRAMAQGRFPNSFVIGAQHASTADAAIAACAA